MSSSEYLELFRSEAREHLNNIQQLLLDLEEHFELDHCKELLQILHTLKGDANLVNKKHIANLAHGLEDVIKEVQAGRLHLRKSSFVLISQKVELLSEYVEQEKDPPQADEVIRESLLHLQQLTQGTLATTRMIVKPVATDEIESSFQEALFSIPKKENETPPLPIPILEEPPSSLELPDTHDLVEISLNGIAKKTDHEDTRPHPVVPPPQQTKSTPLKKPRSDSKLYHATAGQDSLRIPMKKIDDLIDLMGEIAIIKDKLENKLYHSFCILEDLKKLATSDTESITERYSNFYDEFSQDVAELELVANELKIQSLDVKMVPIATILTDSYTLVRNKSMELGKNVAPLQVTGGETKVDKSLLESLRKMLIHLLLNSLTHGIEPETERVQSGKKPAGMLRINALTKSDTIIIEVEDDGRGLSAEHLKRKAVEKGVVSAEEVLGMSDKDAFYLITRPGFSTAEKVTQDSGRGVGMDVVYSTIHKLKGSLNIESEAKKFTRISMVFPVNLSIINAFLVLVQKNIVAIPLNYVKETYIATREQLKIEGGLTILKREKQKDIPVISLARYLHYPSTSHYQEHFVLIILDYQNEALAISLDRFLRLQEIIVKPLTGALKEHHIISGATILRTGEPAVILNIATIFQERKKWYQLRLPLEKNQDPLAYCLFVDNSEMSLMVLDSIFREAGFQTTLASSFKMAQERYLLQPFEVVLINISLDYKEAGGFELLRWIRARSPKQKVILASNTYSKEIVRLSYQHGADLHVCKLGFQSQKFLAKVKQLLENSDD